MNTKQLIKAIFAVIITMPCLLIFNDNDNTIYFNFIGLMYSLVLYKYSHKNKALKTAYLSFYKVSYKLMNNN